MKVLVHDWEMGSFPFLVPYKEGEDDARRTIEVPEDLYERLVDAHEEFCAVLNEVDVECIQILDAPAPATPRLEYGTVYPGGPYGGSRGVDGWQARCASCEVASDVVPGRLNAEDRDRAFAEVLARGWRERRHGGWACPDCVPNEVVLEEKAVGEQGPAAAKGSR